LWYADIIKQKANKDNDFQTFSVDQKSLASGAAQIFNYFEANVYADAAAVQRGA